MCCICWMERHKKSRVSRGKELTVLIENSWFQGTLTCHNILDLCTLPLCLCHSNCLLDSLSLSVFLSLSVHNCVLMFPCIVVQLHSLQAYTSKLLMLYFNMCTHSLSHTHTQFYPSIHPNLSPPQLTHSPAGQYFGCKCVHMSEERTALPDLHWPPALLHSAEEVNICTQFWTAESCLQPSSLHSMKYS